MDMLDKGMIQLSSGMEWDSVGFHHATEKHHQFKTFELLISGTFPCNIFRSWLMQVTKNRRK
jgi:hypothetical protein